MALATIFHRAAHRVLDVIELLVVRDPELGETASERD